MYLVPLLVQGHLNVPAPLNPCPARGWPLITRTLENSRISETRFKQRIHKETVSVEARCMIEDQPIRIQAFASTSSIPASKPRALGAR